MAGANLAHLAAEIAQLGGFGSIITNTFNIKLEAPYYLQPDWEIPADRYNNRERLLFQRARIAGIRALIMRPHTHELPTPWGHGPAHVELMAPVRIRPALGIGVGQIALVTVEVEGNDEWWHGNVSP